MTRPLAATLLAAALTLPVSAHALSCMPRTLEEGIAGDFAQAAQSPTPFVVLRGTVAHDEDYRTDEEEFRFEAVFEGRQLMPSGESEIFSSTVVIDGICVNGDCGYLAPTGVEQHFLAAFDDGGLRITVFPCADFPNIVSPRTSAAVAACLAGDC